jgi:DNA-binding PadR family transcriptional regulator
MFEQFFDGTCGPRMRAETRAKWGWDPSFMSGFFGAEGRPRGRWRGGRMFEQGDLRYVVLRLLEEKPRHGYEIIKALEERFGGAYAPSPGAVYPILQLLEDLGYARIVPGDEGKKVYEITDAGRAHLAENQSTVDNVFERMSKIVGHFLDEPMTEVHAAFREVGKAAYGRATSAVDDAGRLKSIAEILKRAAKEIEDLPR